MYLPGLPTPCINSCKQSIRVVSQLHHLSLLFVSTIHSGRWGRLRGTRIDILACTGIIHLSLETLVRIDFGATLRRSVRRDVVVLTVGWWGRTILVERYSLSVAPGSSVVDDRWSRRKEMWIACSLGSRDEKLQYVSHARLQRGK